MLPWKSTWSSPTKKRSNRPASHHQVLFNITSHEIVEIQCDDGLLCSPSCMLSFRHCLHLLLAVHHACFRRHSPTMLVTSCLLAGLCFQLSAPSLYSCHAFVNCHPLPCYCVCRITKLLMLGGMPAPRGALCRLCEYL